VPIRRTRPDEGCAVRRPPLSPREPGRQVWICQSNAVQRKGRAGRVRSAEQCRQSYRSSKWTGDAKGEVARTPREAQQRKKLTVFMRCAFFCLLRVLTFLCPESRVQSPLVCLRSKIRRPSLGQGLGWPGSCSFRDAYAGPREGHGSSYSHLRTWTLTTLCESNSE